MTIDTAKLRRQFPMNVAEERNTIVHDLHRLCDELDQARADVLKLRDKIYVSKIHSNPRLSFDALNEALADTEHYEEYRK